MPRTISMTKTVPQIRLRLKSVTRRFAWWNVQPGTRLWAVEKAMGLKRGEKQKRLALIEVTEARTEPLNAITQDDCILEGFPDLAPEAFVAMLIEGTTHRPDAPVRRIAFRYVERAEMDIGQPVPVFVTKNSTASPGLGVCNMASSSMDELVTIARKIDLDHSWVLADEGCWQPPYTLIPLAKRAAAIAAGAQEVSQHDLGQMIRAHRIHARWRNHPMRKELR